MNNYHIWFSYNYKCLKKIIYLFIKNFKKYKILKKFLIQYIYKWIPPMLIKIEIVLPVVIAL